MNKNKSENVMCECVCECLCMFAQNKTVQFLIIDKFQWALFSFTIKLKSNTIVMIGVDAGIALASPCTLQRLE